MKQLELNLPLDQDQMSRPTGPTFLCVSELFCRIDADLKLVASRKRDLRSAAHRIIAIMGYKDRPDDLILKPAEVRTAINKTTAAQLQISDKRLRNLRSDIKTLVERYLLPHGAVLKDVTLSPAWEALRDSCRSHPDLYYGLVRFMRYCTSISIVPKAVTDQTLKEYMDWVEATVILKDPLKIQRQNRNAWNRAIKNVAGWPQTELKNPRPSNTYTLPLSAFPANFQAEAKAWLELLQDDDSFNEDAPSRPLKPASIKTRRYQVRQIASAMVKVGRPLAEFTSLITLIDFDWTSQALAYISERTKNGPTYQKSSLLYVLQVIAKHWVHADKGIIKRLAIARKKQSPKPDSMPSQNRERLAKLKDQAALTKLITLPIDLLFEAKRGKHNSQKTLHMLEAALLIEILLMYPLRLKNLAGLKLGRHVKIIGEGRNRRVQIMVPEDEVKNGMPLLATLPPESMPIFDAYMERARPKLCRDANDWLFPGPKQGAHKHQDTLGRRVKSTIWNWIGLEVNVHAFRHVDTLIYLTDRPGHYEDVRRILAHTNTETVAKYYADLEVQPAVDRLHDSILGIRNMKVPV
ncbi:MAG: hypothetical protein RIC85_04260 [Gammaproteobacteria bacterium]